MAEGRQCVLVRRHPHGGFCVLLVDVALAGVPEPDVDQPTFDALPTAVAFASGRYSGLVVEVHPECHVAGVQGGYDIDSDAVEFALDAGAPLVPETPEWVRILRDWSADTGNAIADDMRREALAASDRVWNDPHLRALVVALQTERDRGRDEGERNAAES